MTLLRRIRVLFVRAEDLSAACLLLIYPIAVLATVWIYPVWERYGIRFQVLCNSALVAMAVILCSADALKRFSRWFWHSKFIYLLPVWITWLLLMGFTHGFSASNMHGQGLFSGALLALASPFVYYVFASIRSRWILLTVPVLLLVVVFSECLFLSVYTAMGVGHNDSFTFFGDEIPRVFLNTRDGGSWAVALSIYAFYLWLKLSSRFDGIKMSLQENAVVCVALIPVYYLALITSARGVVVSIAMAALLSLLSNVVRFRELLKFISLNLFSLAVAQLCLSLFRLSIASSYQLHQRLAQGDSARLHMIQSWLASFQADRWAWYLGKGFNHYPWNFLPEGDWPTNVHNLYVQFIVDAGAVGLVVAALSAWIILRGIHSATRSVSSLVRPVLVYASAAFFVYSATSALLFWPSGVWISMLLLIIPIRLGKEGWSDIPGEINAAKGGRLGWKLMPGYLIFALFLVIQVPLVTYRHTLLADPFFGTIKNVFSSMN